MNHFFAVIHSFYNLTVFRGLGLFCIRDSRWRNFYWIQYLFLLMFVVSYRILSRFYIFINIKNFKYEIIWWRAMLKLTRSLFLYWYLYLYFNFLLLSYRHVQYNKEFYSDEVSLQDHSNSYCCYFTVIFSNNIHHAVSSLTWSKPPVQKNICDFS